MMSKHENQPTPRTSNEEPWEVPLPFMGEDLMQYVQRSRDVERGISVEALVDIVDDKHSVGRDLYRSCDKDTRRRLFSDLKKALKTQGVSVFQEWDKNKKILRVRCSHCKNPFRCKFQFCLYWSDDLHWYIKRGPGVRYHTCIRVTPPQEQTEKKTYRKRRHSSVTAIPMVTADEKKLPDCTAEFTVNTPLYGPISGETSYPPKGGNDSNTRRDDKTRSKMIDSDNPENEASNDNHRTNARCVSLAEDETDNPPNKVSNDLQGMNARCVSLPKDDGLNHELGELEISSAAHARDSVVSSDETDPLYFLQNGNGQNSRFDHTLNLALSHDLEQTPSPGLQSHKVPVQAKKNAFVELPEQGEAAQHDGEHLVDKALDQTDDVTERDISLFNVPGLMEHLSRETENSGYDEVDVDSLMAGSIGSNDGMSLASDDADDPSTKKDAFKREKSKDDFEWARFDSLGSFSEDSDVSICDVESTDEFFADTAFAKKTRPEESRKRHRNKTPKVDIVTKNSDQESNQSVLPTEASPLFGRESESDSDDEKKIGPQRKRVATSKRATTSKWSYWQCQPDGVKSRRTMSRHSQRQAQCLALAAITFVACVAMMPAPIPQTYNADQYEALQPLRMFRGKRKEQLPAPLEQHASRTQSLEAEALSSTSVDNAKISKASGIAGGQAATTTAKVNADSRLRGPQQRVRRPLAVPSTSPYESRIAIGFTLSSELPETIHKLVIQLWPNSLHTGTRLAEQILHGVWKSASIGLDKSEGVLVVTSQVERNQDSKFEFTKATEKTHAAGTVCLSLAGDGRTRMLINENDNTVHNGLVECVGTIGSLGGDGYEALRGRVHDPGNNIEPTISMVTAAIAHETNTTERRVEPKSQTGAD